jgi:hypothetical protein
VKSITNRLDQAEEKLLRIEDNIKEILYPVSNKNNKQA